MAKCPKKVLAEVLGVKVPETGELGELKTKKTQTENKTGSCREPVFDSQHLKVPTAICNSSCRDLTPSDFLKHCVHVGTQTYMKVKHPCI